MPLSVFSSITAERDRFVQGLSHRSALWRSALWRSALWRSALWRSALWRSALWRSALWRSALWRSALWQSALWQSALWQSALWQSALWQSALWQSALWQSSQDSRVRAFFLLQFASVSGLPGADSAKPWYVEEPAACRRSGPLREYPPRIRMLECQFLNISVKTAPANLKRL